MTSTPIREIGVFYLLYCPEKVHYKSSKSGIKKQIVQEYESVRFLN